MFNLRLGIIRNILQYYQLLIVYQLLSISYSNAENVQSSNRTGFCNGHRIQRELQKVLLDSQRRNKISMDYLTGTIFTESKRISDVLFTPNGNHNYDDFVKSLTNLMEKLESEVVSCYIGINDETKEFLNFLKNLEFTSDNETGICQNQQLQTLLQDYVKNLSDVIVHSFSPIIQTLNQLTVEIRKGPINSSDTPDDSRHYDYIRNYLLDITMDLRTETGIAMYKSMRVVFVITRIISYELHDPELVDKKLIKNLMAAYNDVLDGGSDSENSTLPYSSEIFAEPYVQKGANVNQTNLNLGKLTIRDEIADILFGLIGTLIGDLIAEAIKYVAGLPPWRSDSLAVSTGTTSINDNDVNYDKDPNCTVYYNELREEIFEGLQESSALIQQTIPKVIQLYQNITKFLAKINSRPHILPQALRIAEWLEVGEKLYSEVLNFVTICTPLFINYMGKLEAIYNQSVVTSRKLLSANCLNHMLIYQTNLAVSEDKKTLKRVRFARDIVPMVSQLMDILPLNMEQYGPIQDVNQPNASTVNTNSTNAPLSSAENTDSAEWMNLLRSVSKMVLRKFRFLLNSMS